MKEEIQMLLKINLDFKENKMYLLKINQRSEGTFLSDPSVTSKVITINDLKLQQSNKDILQKMA